MELLANMLPTTYYMLERFSWHYSAQCVLPFVPTIDMNFIVICAKYPGEKLKNTEMTPRFADHVDGEGSEKAEDRKLNALQNIVQISES